MTDSGNAYRPLIYEFDHMCVNHSVQYSDADGINNNQAESYMSRLRRAEYGVFRGMRANYFLDYCVEMAWREDYRRHTIKERLKDIFQRIGNSIISISFCRYYQGNRRIGEWSDCFDALSKVKK